MSGGQQLTVGQGSLVYRPFRPAIEVQQGFLTPAGDAVLVGITGEEITSEQGSTVVGAPLLSGQVITSGIGTLTYDGVTVPLLGAAITASAGFMTAGLDADDTFISVQQGFVVRGQTADLTGEAITAGQGTIEYSLYFLTGEQATLAQGTTVQIVAVALTGAQTSLSAGTVTRSTDAELFLSGQEISALQGTVFTDDMVIPQQSSGSGGGNYRYIGAQDYGTCEEEVKDLEEERKKVEREIAKIERQIDEKQDRVEYEDNMRLLNKLIQELTALQKRLDALQVRLLEIEAEEMMLLTVVCEEMD